MLNKWPIALGSLTAAVIGVVVALAVAGIFDSDSAARPGDGGQAESAALCVEGVEDCQDTVVVPVGDEDDDVDLNDIARFQLCFSGSDAAADPNCGD